MKYYGPEIILLCIISAPRLLLGQNLLPDEGFEKGGAEWSVFVPAENQTAGCQFGIVDGQEHSGHRAVRLLSKSVARYGIYPAAGHMYLPVKAGERYRFVAWVKAGDDFHQEAGTPGVLMRATLFEKYDVNYKNGHIFIGLDGVSQPSTAPPPGQHIVSKDWTKLDGVVEIPQGVTQMIFFIFCWKGSGQLWVDDLSVVKL